MPTLPRIEANANAEPILFFERGDAQEVVSVNLLDDNESAKGLPMTLRLILSTVDGDTHMRLVSEYVGAMADHWLAEGRRMASEPAQDPKSNALRLVDTLRLQVSGRVS